MTLKEFFVKKLQLSRGSKFDGGGGGIVKHMYHRQLPVTLSRLNVRIFILIYPSW